VGPMKDRKPQQGSSWTISCDGGHFSKELAEPRFAPLVTLARIVNNLRYHTVATMPVQNEDTPATIRQRMSSFLNMAGCLYEGLQFTKRLGVVYRGVPAFDEGLGAILRDPVTQKLEGKALKRLRHKVVYHHDEQATEQALRVMEGDESYTFASGSGFRKADVYYELADLAAFHQAVADPDDDRPFMEKLRELFADMAALANRFANDADRLVVGELTDAGWQKTLDE